MATQATDPAIDELKQRARATWAAGNYDAVVTGIWPVGERLVARVGVTNGDRVLDVAAGTGNAALRAALAGGAVTALDITPELIEAGRRRAAEAGVDIEWVEGDAEQLPFPDASFDVVLSTFGVMFAPRHAVAAGEMLRVLRPGGRIGLATWTPDGAVADLFRAVSAEIPPSPLAGPPLAWGDPDHVRQLLAGATLDFAVEQLEIKPDVDAEGVVDFYLASFGPLVMARRALEPQGRWEALEAKLRPIIRSLVTQPASYLVTTGTRA
ncbi:MAG TPA: methyltransferase domain-containing protein [candidate division Zixibacteria bacterium]|nr:methyltransferase domain-containing protein [candidate division Zixibacteria bacterium]